MLAAPAGTASPPALWPPSEPARARCACLREGAGRRPHGNGRLVQQPRLRSDRRGSPPVYPVDQRRRFCGRHEGSDCRYHRKRPGRHRPSRVQPRFTGSYRPRYRLPLSQRHQAHRPHRSHQESLNVEKGVVNESGPGAGERRRDPGDDQVMGGEDWERWVGHLSRAGLLNPGFKTSRTPTSAASSPGRFTGKPRSARPKKISIALPRPCGPRWRPLQRRRARRGVEGRRHAGQLRDPGCAAVRIPPLQGHEGVDRARRLHPPHRSTVPVPRCMPAARRLTRSGWAVESRRLGVRDRTCRPRCDADGS